MKKIVEFLKSGLRFGLLYSIIMFFTLIVVQMVIGVFLNLVDLIVLGIDNYQVDWQIIFNWGVVTESFRLGSLLGISFGFMIYIISILISKK